MSKILKQYDIKQIEALSKEYGYVSLEDINGTCKMAWNTRQTAKYPDHLKACIKRLNSEAIEDGFYYFCFANSTRTMKNADKFLVQKGTGNQHPEIIQQATTKIEKDNILTVDKALSYITEIANLKVEIGILKAENARLETENKNLNEEIEVLESETENLSESNPSGTESYLKEISPSLMALADKFLSQRDRSLDLEEKKLSAQPKQEIKKRTIQVFETGSEPHLNLIRLYHKQGNETMFNLELDKLEASNNDLYNQMCNELGIQEEPQ